MAKGTLYLIPTTLGEGPATDVIPEAALHISRKLVHFIAESDRTARRYLKFIGTEIPLNDLIFSILDKHTAPDTLDSMVKPLLSGTDMGLISEAGLPALADPGAAIVARCHKAGIPVKPLTGPSSITLALIASGFNGQAFTFHGYLPVDSGERTRRIKALERELQQTGYTQIFIETPFRNQKMLEAILSACRDETLLSIARDITVQGEFIATRSIGQWKKQLPNLNKIPAVFLMGQWQ
jgi:16S rRNA (cytidine1402-2'-O)-methyltransferase